MATKQSGSAAVRRRLAKEKTKRHRAPSVKHCGRGKPLLVVGLGASAGGLEAFQQFFRHMPADSGLTLVLIVHLDPHQKSVMAEVLRRATPMPVISVTAPAAIEPNHAYLIAPGTALTIEGGRLVPTASEDVRAPIDAFFLSLAEAYGARAACVVLSGTGSDGSIGLKAVKEHGGLTIAQASESAQHSGMPRSAAATGLVDMVLPAEKIAAKLLDHGRQVSRLRDGRAARSLDKETRNYLVNICTILRAKTGHDFSQYKESTLARRIQRRMQVHQLENVTSYVDRLRRDAGEVTLLFQDLLIGVTHFFRDRQAFAALEKKVIPKLFKNCIDDKIRIWVPGCATGEEPYSIAILLREYMQRHDVPVPKIQIFATDIDEKALEVARAGVYPEGTTRDVSARRLKQFFAPRGNGYQITKDIREMCVFSAHDLIRDAPFSRLDLISCRNVLIYMNAELQSRVLTLFHFALRTGRFLFLGPSENVTQQSKFFGVVDVKHRLFRATAAVGAHLPALPMPERGERTAATRPTLARASGQKELIGAVERTLLGVFTPAHVVVNDRQELIYASAGTGRYLELPAGAPNSNLLNMARKGLRLELRAALIKALEGRRKVVHNDVAVDVNGGTQTVRIVVQPLTVGDDAGTFYLVVFEDVGAPHPEAAAAKRPGVREDKLVRQLEAELHATQERLQTTIEELETSNEELKSSNEEFQSMNEELQSANEELETVNAELNAKVESVDRANSDLKNLLESTQIAALFLDRDGRIRNFTPAARDIFHLIDADVGRPIADIVTRLSDGMPAEDVARVMRTLTPIEREVQLQDRRTTMILRILPYRTVDNVINGVVMTFIDITQRKHDEEALRVSAAQLRMTLAAAQAGAWELNLVTGEPTWSPEIYALYGLEPGTNPPPLERWFADYLHEADRDSLKRDYEAFLHSRRTEFQWDFRIRHPKRDVRWLLSKGSVARAKNGKPLRLSGINVDITRLKQAEETQRLLLAELNHRVKNMLATVLSIANQTIRESNSLQSFQKAFIGRVRALSTTQNALSRSNWTGVALRDIIAAETAPFAKRGGGTFETAGPDIKLSPRAALSLALTLHELTTNALKYGGLSRPNGQVDLQWKLADGADGRQLVIDWRESRGPTVKAPARTGFGRRLIEQATAYELGGTSQLDFRPDGVACHIAIPAGKALVDAPIENE